MKVLAKFYWDCGRMGDVHGLFICDKADLEAAYGREVYFGEILGKHSEIYGTLEANDITVKSEDQDFIAKLLEIIGSSTISGYNPLSYFSEEDEEEE